MTHPRRSGTPSTCNDGRLTRPGWNADQPPETLPQPPLTELTLHLLSPVGDWCQWYELLMDVLIGDAEAHGRRGLEVDLDQHRMLVAHHPGVVPR